MFKTVEIKKGKDTIQGTLDEGVLSVPNKIGKNLETISIGNKSYKVIDERVDERDGLLILTLDVPDGTGAKANEQSTEGNS